MKRYRVLKVYRKYPEKIFKDYCSKTYQVMYLWNMFTKETKMYINALRKLYNDKHRKHYKEGELEFIINIYQFEPTSVNPIPFLYALGDKRYDKRMIKGAYISSLSIHKYSIPSTEKERQVLYWKQI